MSRFFYYMLGGLILGIGIELTSDKALDESINNAVKKVEMLPRAEKATPKAGS